MLHKFLLWKTNKEQTGRYPAYIIYHTDFSSGRKEMINEICSILTMNGRFAISSRKNLQTILRKDGRRFYYE